MPFTFSHPALIIPLLHARRGPQLSATGLIIGSIAPDFEKFFKLKLASDYSHTIPSIFYFSCPVGLGLAFVFHLVVRRPLLKHLPRALQRRLSQYESFDWLRYCRQHYWQVLLSLILGAALHLGWDSFTHYNELSTSFLPGLTRVIWFGPWAVSLYEAIAVGSSVMGLLAIAWAIWQLPTHPISPTPSLAIHRYWSVVALVAAGLTLVWVLATQPILLNAGIAAISATLIGVIGASVCARYWEELLAACGKLNS